MDVTGPRRDLVLAITRVLFGETAYTVVDAIIDYGPCPIGFIQQRTNISEENIQTILLAMYVHGCINIEGKGKRALISLSTLPLLVLSAPSIVVDEIKIKTGSQQLADVMRAFISQGLCATNDIGQYIDDIEPENVPKLVKNLFDMGFLSRKITNYFSFNSYDVRSVERRIANLNLMSRKSVSSQPRITPPVINPVIQFEESDDDVFTVNWAYVAEFLRERYIVNYVGKLFSKEHARLATKILLRGNCLSYNSYRIMSGHKDDQLKNELIGYPRIDTEAIIYDSDELSQNLDKLDDAQKDVERLAQLRAPCVGLLLGEGKDAQVRVPMCVRAIQVAYATSYAEHSLCQMHGRVFAALQNLEVADTRQLENAAVVSDMEARRAVYGLMREGLVLTQAIPKQNDAMIAQTIFAYRYDEEGAVREYAKAVGRTALNLWDRLEGTILEAEANGAEAEETEAGISEYYEKRTRDYAKWIAGFQATYIEQLRVLILLTEM